MSLAVVLLVGLVERGREGKVWWTHNSEQGWGGGVPESLYLFLNLLLISVVE